MPWEMDNVYTIARECSWEFIFSFWEDRANKDFAVIFYLFLISVYTRLICDGDKNKV